MTAISPQWPATRAMRYAKRMVWGLLLFGVISPALPANADAFRIASYNVENLFDLHRDRTEYDDYAPHGPSEWNRASLYAKLDNIARVLKDLDADVVCLQEIESAKAMALLRERLRGKGMGYAHAAIADDRPSAVKCAVLSRFPIIEATEIAVGRGHDRNILKASLDIDGTPLILYVNHWKSKSGPESRRLRYARALAEDIDRLKHGAEFVVAGDFNANYNEYQTFRNVHRLNDTGGVTGINHVLGTLDNGRMVDEAALTRGGNGRRLYNLWLELPAFRRWSVTFQGRKETPDAILLPASLYDDTGVNYVDNSFEVFAPPYLLKKNRIYRWQREDNGRGRHLGRGFSDHLPVVAEFDTRPFRAADIRIRRNQ